MDTNKYEGFEELKNFVRGYFGDFWEGKSERDIIDAAVEENPKEYLGDIVDIIYRFIALDSPLDEKRDYLEWSGVYTKNGKEATNWLRQIATLLDEAMGMPRYPD